MPEETTETAEQSTSWVKGLMEAVDSLPTSLPPPVENANHDPIDELEHHMKDALSFVGQQTQDVNHMRHVLDEYGRRLDLQATAIRAILGELVLLRADKQRSTENG